VEADRSKLESQLQDVQLQLKSERRIVETLAASIHSHTQSFRQIALALPSGPGDLPRPAPQPLASAAPAQPHTFEFLGKQESKALGSFLDALRIGQP
jgi:hypothetical protein